MLNGAQKGRIMAPTSQKLFTGFVRERIDYFRAKEMKQKLEKKIQNSSVLSIYPYGGNEWFNFSTQSYKNGEVNGSDPMINGQLLLEGNNIVELK